VLKFLQEFLEVIFYIVAMESLLIEVEVWTRQSRTGAQKGHNFSSNRWISLKCFQEFPKVFFLVEALESLLGEEEV
jgi:hypothetical protein